MKSTFNYFLIVIFFTINTWLAHAQNMDKFQLEEDLNQRFTVSPTRISSAFTELSPIIWISQGGIRNLMFVSDRYRDYQKNPFGIYFMEIQNDSVLKPEVNSTKIKFKKKQVASATTSPDGLTLIFSAAVKKKNMEYFSLFQSKYNYTKNKWSKPKELGKISGIRTVSLSPDQPSRKFRSSELNPSISADGLTLAFASDRDGGIGKYDIWISRRTPEGWSTPVQAGDGINTTENEMSPYLNGDGSILSFASNGRGGVGGLDLFLSFKNGDVWSVAKSMGEPINSSADDYGMYPISDSSLYFVSGREGGAGQLDIYRADYRRGNAHEGGVSGLQSKSLTVNVEGKVLNKSDKKELVNIKATLYELKEDGSWGEVQKAEPEKERFAFKLQENKKYKIEGGALGYIPSEVYINTGMIDKNLSIVIRDIMVEPDVFGLYADYYNTISKKEIDFVFKINNIYYDYDKYFIRPDAATELNKIFEIMKLHPEMKIMITSHTDSKASPEYNQKLSDLRAGAAVKYLVEKGIQAGRISFKGMGETKPVYFPEKNEYEMQINRRTEFRITSLKYEAQSVIPDKIQVDESIKKEKGKK